MPTIDKEMEDEIVELLAAIIIGVNGGRDPVYIGPCIANLKDILNEKYEEYCKWYAKHCDGLRGLNQDGN